MGTHRVLSQQPSLQPVINFGRRAAVAEAIHLRVRLGIDIEKLPEALFGTCVLTSRFLRDTRAESSARDRGHHWAGGSGFAGLRKAAQPRVARSLPRHPVKDMGIVLDIGRGRSRNTQIGMVDSFLPRRLAKS